MSGLEIISSLSSKGHVGNRVRIFNSPAYDSKYKQGLLRVIRLWLSVKGRRVEESRTMEKGLMEEVWVE